MPSRPVRQTTMTDIDRRLPPHARRGRDGQRTLVVIAADEPAVARLELASSPWAGARLVTVLEPSGAELDDRLSELSEVSLVVDARTSTGPAQLDAFHQGFLHLGPRRAWVALRSGAEEGEAEPLLEVARRVREARDAPKRRPADPVARQVARARITPRLVALVAKRRPHALTLREDRLPLLETREPDLQVTTLARLEAGVLDATGLSHDYGRAPVREVPAVLPYPEHSVRRYQGRVQLPVAALAHHGRTVLPDSFRWHLSDELGSGGLRTVTDRFGVVKDEPGMQALEGSYYLFLYSNPGHFGHLMTEALAKLWGWWPAKAADPSLKMLCRLHPSPEREQTPQSRLEADLLPAFGIPPEDVVWVEGPVEVTSLTACTPMWHNAPPFYVQPQITETWDRIRTGLIGTEPATGPSRIFVTRRDQVQRECANAEEVEAIFAAHGFTIVLPEELRTAEQARTFAAARVVAGLGGAGMFNLAYSHAVEHVIVLNQWAYEARNEHLFAVAHGAQLHSFWSPPDIDHPPGGSSYQAHQSEWTCDLETLERPLRDLLERLAD